MSGWTAAPGPKPLVAGASAVAEGLWVACFLGLGRLRARAPAEWRPLGGGRVLAVAPHPDDETLGCGGALVRHRQAGDRVRVLMVTDGRASRAGGLQPVEMAARREAEARQAMATLGLDLLWLGLPEGAWPPEALAPTLATELARADLVYAPSPIDYHPEHLRVARVLGQVASRRVRVYELGVPLGAGLTSLLADTTAVEPLRQAALAAYRSQTRGIANLRRLRRYAGAYWQAGGLGEPFWELGPEAYRAVVVTAGQWTNNPFRGLRARAFSDPLSYLVGQAARRRLARAAAAAAERA